MIAQVISGQLPLLLLDGVEPAGDGLIVVSSRVDHAVFRVIVGKVIAGAAGIPGIEGKLQHLHSRIPRLLYQPAHRVRHIAQILGDNLLFAQSLSDPVEKVDSRSLLPVSRDRGVCVCRYGKILIKSPEMIDAHHVVELIAVSQTADPPLITGISVVFPVIKRVSPQLSCG